MQTLIKNLVEAWGPSGFEDSIRAMIRAEIEPFVDQITVDAMGNLIALKKGSGADGSRKKVMIVAHMDEIGFMVSHINEEGFLRFTNIGGVNNLHLGGLRVRFEDGTIGVIYSEKRASRLRLGGLDTFYIDIGVDSRDDSPIKVGEAGIFQQTFFANGDRLTAKSMDDRVGCAVAIATLQQLENSPHDVYFVFSVQEEVGVRGATVAANRIAPDVGIALDVTVCGDTPKGAKIDVKLGKGPAIKVKDTGMIAHRGLVQLMGDVADSAEIPHQYEILVGGSTDARAIQLSGAGVISGCISIPCRYVHSPSETVSLSDVENSVKLLTLLLNNPLDL